MIYDTKKLDLLLDSMDERFGVPACELIVRCGYDEIYHRVCGYSDHAKTMPASENDVYWLFSETKLFTCVSAMQLVERGVISLDDPVSKWLPEYADVTVMKDGNAVPCENVMTIRHLMSMTGGLSYDLDVPEIAGMRKSGASTREMVRIMAGVPLQFEPGTHFRYSLCHDVLAAIIEVASGMDFYTYLRKNICEPLGIENIGFIPDGVHNFSAQYKFYDEDRMTRPVETENRYRLTENYCSGGAGLWSTAKDYILLPEALANGGVGRNGNRIIMPESIDEMRKHLLTGSQKAEFNQMKRKTYSYGLGVRVRVTEGRCGEPVGEFGWDGACGAYDLVDTVNKLSIHYVQHIQTPYFWCSDFHDELRETIYGCFINN